MRHVTKIAIFIVATACLSSCIVLAPFIQAWKNVGATQRDRMALFGPQVKKFGEALYWGKGEAVLFVDSSAKPEVRKTLSFQREDMRIVESKIKNVEYSEDAFTANVEFLVKYYRIPYYIVTDATETQVWKFKIGDNWYLQEREVSKEFLR